MGRNIENIEENMDKHMDKHMALSIFGILVQRFSCSIEQKAPIFGSVFG